MLKINLLFDPFPLSINFISSDLIIDGENSSFPGALHTANINLVFAFTLQGVCKGI